MGDRQLQHWVPQHHMRLYADHPRKIGVATRRTGTVVASASIRHQCARHMFYGDRSVEDALGLLESRHSRAYRAVIQLAWHSGPSLSVMQQFSLREALVLQRSRTPSHAAVAASTMDQATLHTYAEHLRASSGTKKTRRLIRAIEEGRARLRHSRAFALQLALSSVEETTPLTQDLVLKVLRNRTDVPFLLGDAPSVYSNHYQRDVAAHGVLGIVSQGLMIAMPLNPSTYLLAVDPAKYKFRENGRVVDLGSVEDINCLNRLQAFAAEECLYFTNPGDGLRAREMLVACPHSGTQRSGFQVLEEVASGNRESPQHRTFRPLAEGDDSGRGDLLMMFERQLPETLALSVIETVEFEGVSAAYGPRLPSLVEQFETTNGAAYNQPLGIDELVRQVEGQLETW